MSSSSLHVIALISGGKDSFFSILHCQANGHSIVALANLYPPPSFAAGQDGDINSYMYQTVGHAVIPLYEQALAIPLYRQEITGKTVNSNRDYELSIAQQEQEQDETEDLVPLLERIMCAHPEANAVSTGAILSTYQRTRVESVALRLGLTPLSYLWQYPLLPPYTQSSLLHDMAAVGQEAVIIKTASGGLDEGFLGLDVAQQKTIARLGKAMGRFGEESNGAILGEGGEFETLALDGPRALWKKRVRVEAAAPGVLEGGQTVFRIKESRLEEKSGDEEGNSAPVRVPELFDEEFKKVLESTEHDDATLPIEPTETSPSAASESLPQNTANSTPTAFTSSNLSSRTSSSPSRQLTHILLRLAHTLTQHHLPKSAINHCTLLLRNMADFTILNPIYAQYFSGVNPPARVTIAAGDAMPSGVHVMLSVVADKLGTEQQARRQGLHVQSRSYWAPANIGPYSQAISVPLPLVQTNSKDEDEDGDKKPKPDEIVYIAGQIPLVPASMAVYSQAGFTGQAALSLQHLWRIGRAKGVRCWTAGVAFIPAGAHAEQRVRTAQRVWKALHSAPSGPSSDSDEGEEESPDPWDRLNRAKTSPFNDTTLRLPIPDHTTTSTSSTPPCFVAQVSSLPRDVDVEWSAMGLASASVTQTQMQIHGSVLTRVQTENSRSRFYALEVREMADFEALREEGVREWTSATLYAGRGFEGSVQIGMGVQWVPCHRVWGDDGKEVRGVLVGRVDWD
ncbi:adenine nucleotide alpha hydrolases-like protein [Dothidotthia symphoricarpi CBS 119687]|uniref:Diphthine--ammonia ligase n=1 Tax=Dothidotthia symphoricarpi CBS 119687 TaxID=1392245 RepID=A0A6A6AQP8_9PLEO|nr:adenine nucleotide alpha hydrolases-like protein [Dothidotthia symphoricarpi CBS 119687]KAF2134312.1 adenine nucleotide alpha hydrolases-like protein [Dothidotthia symphoricarpi CBS 119687]